MDVQLLLNLPQPIKGGDPSSKAKLVLRAGDLLTASVLEVDRGRDALLSFGQFKAYARLPLPVVTGQQIQIQVQQTDSGLRMAMVPKTGGHPAPALPTGGHPPIADQQPDKGISPTGGRGRPAPAPPTGGHPPMADQRSDKGISPTGDRSHPALITSKADNFQIRLFEPVPDRPLLSAHAHLLRQGESLEGRMTGFRKDGMMLVDFGKFKAFAKIDVPVREGQILPLTVVKSGQEMTFSVAARPMTGTPAQAQFSSATQHLAPQLVPTGVEQMRSPVPTTAPHPSAALPLAQPSDTPPGMQPPSVPTHPPTAPEMARFREQIQHLLANPDLSQHAAGRGLSPPTQAALTQLQQMLRPVSPTGDPTAVMTAIRDFVENSGLYFEKRMETVIREVQDRPTPLTPSELAQQPPIRELMVKDLKPNLLILKHFLESQPSNREAADRHLLETMKSVLQRTLAHIDHQQHSATEKPLDPDLFQAFSHLLLLADHRREARLKVYYAKKGRRAEGGQTPRVALLLEMDRMGTVRTDLWMVGRDLNITFFVQAPETKSAIDALKDEIKTALGDSFNTVAVSVVVNEKKIEQFDAEDLGPKPRRLLDLNI